jgi:hypothetical protein
MSDIANQKRTPSDIAKAARVALNRYRTEAVQQQEAGDREKTRDRLVTYVRLGLTSRRP